MSTTGIELPKPPQNFLDVVLPLRVAEFNNNEEIENIKCSLANIQQALWLMAEYLVLDEYQLSEIRKALSYSPKHCAEESTDTPS